MEPFKNRISAELIEHLAARLRAAWPAFDANTFMQQALHDLQALELKARVVQVCGALEHTLPADFTHSAALLQPLMTGDDALEGWVLWPVGEYVARAGLHEPQRALALLHCLTQRFTAEFALRPFIVQHPELTLRTLAGWATDENEHVRRLVSEGSRPRLPWGLRLHTLVADPGPTLPLLRALQDDPSEYVRRSVANHLNDIAKDHPELLLAWLAEHLPGAPPARRALLRHASRTLIKQGHAQVLQAWGLGQRLRGQVVFGVTPAQVAVGDSVTLTLTLRSTLAHAQRLAIDYVLHHVKASGTTSAKVFKGWTLELPARASITLVKRHSMRAVTTRRYHAGLHAIDVQINGEVRASAAFDLTLMA